MSELEGEGGVQNTKYYEVLVASILGEEMFNLLKIKYIDQTFVKYLSRFFCGG